ncbi:MAG: hypothetical protein Fur009_3500 [Candidatus Microgenomates bacterium]
MLTSEIKRKIDTARDILVGKVPDPKAQVEQITIALIYKFMDDMDKTSIELGGKARFFTNGYEKYSWTKLMDSKLGGQERLNLYIEAITTMTTNPHIPQLFRDIFKGAFLPYRSPETLNLFLKEIDGFAYNHSEDLGDAYEYLLSVLGSQGDAGQFRTPRHLIDFIVEVVDPKKDETVCDPACGTAGFLISAYKHILKNNQEKPLTPDEKKALMDHFFGYDISPDMVNISKVNMYLHGFPNPTIFEYDTLTYEDKWDEVFDVMLANPPFMTPKGGIKPHKRFSVQANRTEVLFVDYIAEHLTPTGRTAVIVPEGIIFQSANAYKQLRKMLVENYLYAVVSLPAGVFNPYSGVKTSILLMDRQLAKKTDSILFVKIENDGFNLGAQRRPIDKNDLPDALNVIKDYVTAVRNNTPESFIAQEKPCNALLVKKEKLAENGEYNLTRDRYRIIETRKHQKWPMVKLYEKTIIKKGSPITKNEVMEGNIPVIAGGQMPAYFHNEANREGKTITVSSSGAYAGFINYFKQPIFASDCTTIQTADENELNSDFLYYILKSKQQEFYALQKGMGQPHVYAKDFQQFQIPLPPLEVQREIVAEIEGYQKLIDGCRQVIESWKPDVEGYLDEELKTYLAEHPEKQEELAEGWPMVRLGEVCEIESGSRQEGGAVSEGVYSIGGEQIAEDGSIRFDKMKYITRKYFSEMRRGILRENDVLMLKDGATTGKIGFWKYSYEAAVNEHVYIFRANKYIESYFLFRILQSEKFQDLLKPYKKGIIGGVSLEIQNIQIPLPPLEVQQEIVTKIEAERKVIDGLREMIKTYEEKIKRVIGRVWG